MTAETERQRAEQAYNAAAFDYVRAPIGSRDWAIFWQGWQAAIAGRADEPSNVRDAGPTPFAGRNAGVNRG